MKGVWSKMRALVRNEWDPIDWDGDVWENSDKVEYIKFINFKEIILGRKRFPHPQWCRYPQNHSLSYWPLLLDLRELILHWPSITMLTFLRTHPHHWCLTRSITRLRNQKTLKCEVHDVIHDDFLYVSKELAFSVSYKR